MKIFGLIESVPEKPFTDEEWDREVDRNPHLEMPDLSPIEGVNPFTGKPHLFYPATGSATVLLNGNAIGKISKAEDGSQALVLNAMNEEFEKFDVLAREIATNLGGCLVREEEL